MRGLPYATEAVYPWCSLHQSLIVLAAAASWALVGAGDGYRVDNRRLPAAA